MNVIVNGETRDLEDGCTVSRLVEELRLGDAPCAVEVNRTVIRKAEHVSTTLGEGDTIEIVTLVGGG